MVHFFGTFSIQEMPTTGPVIVILLIFGLWRSREEGLYLLTRNDAAIILGRS